MHAQLVSESIRPVPGETVCAVTAGAPLLPAKFIWRVAEHVVAEVLEMWKETGACTHGSGKRYVRKHWFRIRTVRVDEMKIYFERKARSTRQSKQRWWLYTFVPAAS